MSIFIEPWKDNNLDWLLLQNEAVHFYSDIEYFEEDIIWLKKSWYEIFEFNSSMWNSISDFHDQCKKILKFPDYYWSNLMAFDDYISDMRTIKTGIILTFLNFDSFYGSYFRNGKSII